MTRKNSQVVHKSTSGLLDRREAAISTLEVKVWKPVIGQVLLDLAGCACCTRSKVAVHGVVEGVCAHNGMGMARRHAWADNRIRSFNDQRRAAWQTKEGTGLCSQAGETEQRPAGQKDCRHHEKDDADEMLLK